MQKLLVLFTLTTSAQNLGDMAAFANAAVSLGNAFSSVRGSRGGGFEKPDLALPESQGILGGVSGIGDALTGNCEGEGLCCLFPNFCHPNAECSSSAIVPDNWIKAISAIPTCECKEGFRGLGRNVEDGCLNIDECAEGTSKCTQICQDLAPGYACGCESGFRLINNYDCADIDECMEGIAQCSHQCINTVPGYACACPTGYELGGDLRTCLDINECLNDSTCDFSESCVNFDGGFACSCPAGWSIGLDGRTCVDVNECFQGAKDPETGISRPACSSDGSQMCQNMQGSWLCNCAAGYHKKSLDFPSLPTPPRPSTGTWPAASYNTFVQQVLASTTSLVCEDIDECAQAQDEAKSLCGEVDAQCVNLPGSYTCVCGDGFRFDETLELCVDVDECLEDVCPGDEQTCINTEGSFYCDCTEGYKADAAGQCQDVDECQDADTCSYECVNLPGSYFCTCPDGYELTEGGECVDIDECKAGFCGSSCLNLEGTYLCTCDRSYKESGIWKTLTIDDDLSKMSSTQKAALEEYLETIRNTSPLSPDIQEIRRQNEQKRRNFSMQLGIALGSQCLDFDECQMESAVCPEGLSCWNEIGSFSCYCPSGFELDPYYQVAQSSASSPTSSRTSYEPYPNIDQILIVASMLNTEVWLISQIEWSKYSEAERAALEGQEICNDVDECQIAGVCTGEEPCCENLPGSFMCYRKRGIGSGRFASCPPGTILT